MSVIKKISDTFGGAFCGIFSSSPSNSVTTTGNNNTTTDIQTSTTSTVASGNYALWNPASGGTYGLSSGTVSWPQQAVSGNYTYSYSHMLTVGDKTFIISSLDDTNYEQNKSMIDEMIVALNMLKIRNETKLGALLKD